MWCGAWDTSELSVINLEPLSCVSVIHHVSVVRRLASGCRGKGCRERSAHGGVAAVSELHGDVTVNLDGRLEDIVLAGLAKARDAEFTHR